MIIINEQKKETKLERKKRKKRKENRNRNYKEPFDECPFKHYNGINTARQQVNNTGGVGRRRRRRRRRRRSNSSISSNKRRWKRWRRRRRRRWGGRGAVNCIQWWLKWNSLMSSVSRLQQRGKWSNSRRVGLWGPVRCKRHLVSGPWRWCIRRWARRSCRRNRPICVAWCVADPPSAARIDTAPWHLRTVHTHTHTHTHTVILSIVFFFHLLLLFFFFLNNHFQKGKQIWRNEIKISILIQRG